MKGNRNESISTRRKFPKKQRENRSQMGIHRPALDRRYLGLVFTFANLGTAITGTGNPDLVYGFLFTGYFIFRKTMTIPHPSSPVSYLRNEYERQQALFDAQPTLVQRFIEIQAQRLVDALLSDAQQARFTLPDRVVDKTPQAGDLAAMLIPAQMREQSVGGWRELFDAQSLHETLRRKLNELEQSPDQAIHTSAGLIRYAMAIHMVYRVLPAGRSVTYLADDNEQTPSIPVKSEGEMASALTSAGDAIAEQHPTESGRGELHVPFVPAARRFYLPQWVAFDDDGKLLVNSVNEAEAHLASMQRYIQVLHEASSLAPYMVADGEYQRKRYGILGQLINQGRALAGYRTREIIRAIHERANRGTLNRGLTISLPFFDDQELCMKETLLEAIPAGRIVFKPIFVVRIARLEHAKVSQDTRLNASTRKYLLQQLELLEQAFTHFLEQVTR
jgi:hypothetical protein